MSVDMAVFGRFQEQIKGLAQHAPQDTAPENERLARAKNVMLEKLDSRMAVDLEGCLHCGMCAEVCHFYEGTGDARYTPIHKLTPLRRLYHRELAPMRWAYRLFTRDLSLAELEAWQELVFDSCTECGRCDMVCPVGIRISSMVNVMRQGLAAAGLAAPELRAVSAEQAQHGTIFGVGAEQLKTMSCARPESRSRSIRTGPMCSF